VEEGHHAVLRQRDHDAAARRAAVDRTSAALTGAYGNSYLAELR
jgi:hypothetical protein